MSVLLPADTYNVIKNTVINDTDKKNLIALYEPIIGSISIALYLTLLNDLVEYEIESREFTHHHLMSIMKLDLATLKKSRQALEATGLLKTYFKDGEVASYVYEIYSPLSPKEFFAHPIFNVVLYNNIGKKEYESIKNMYQKMNFNYDGYEDITTSINQTFKSSNMIPEFDVRDKEHSKVGATNIIDFDSIIASIPRSVLNEKALNKKMKELINNLAFIYNLDTLKMVEIIRSTINANGYIDAKELRIKTRDYYTYMNNGKLPTLVYRSQPEYLKEPVGDMSNRSKMIYVFENTTPYDFLKNKYKGVDPTPRDLKLIEYLLVDLELKPAVVNVLVDYTLKKNDNKLSRAYIEAIAGQWKRKGVETASEAMDLAKKGNSKYSKETKLSEKNKNNNPVWFNKEIKKEELTEDEMKIMEDMMKGFN